MEKDNPLRAEKRKKLHNLKETGINPFPYDFDKTHWSVEINEKYSGIEAGDKIKDDSGVRVAGRVMTKRPMGKAAFFNIQDQRGSIQIYLKKEELSDEDKTAFDHLDIGDIVGIDGYPFKTKKGQVSLHCEKFTMLCKTIEPLPEKYHGLTDVELKYRLRHLDLIMNPESRKVFEMRSKIIRTRKFLDDRGFLEVETPILQPIYGGAAARPFKTHHNTLDMDLFMKISPEIYLKRLIVGGFEKVYDLSKNFRNEGIDRSHNPEFAMLEWYEAYTDYEYQMKQFEDLVAHVTKETTGSTKVTYQEKEVDFTTPWKRMTVYEALQEYGNYDVESMSVGDLINELLKMNAIEEKDVNKHKPNKGELTMELFDAVVEKNLWQPTFITDFPKEVSPLTKVHRENNSLVERFEPYVACMELGNAYSELNDPEDQFERLKAQEEKRVVDDEAHPMDEDFIHAIEVGMPPTGGVGLGIERLIMVLTDQASIRDIILFPTMKFK